MDQQWGNRQERFSHTTPQQQAREAGNGSVPQQGSRFGYEPYQTPSLPSNPQSMTVSPIGTPHSRAYTGDGDVAMEDADPYNRMKYPSRPSHQQRSSGQFPLQEDPSTAARRYSPMKAFSPSSSYGPTPQHSAQSSHGPFASQNASARQSPTRPNAYSSPATVQGVTPCMFVFFWFFLLVLIPCEPLLTTRSQLPPTTTASAAYSTWECHAGILLS